MEINKQKARVKHQATWLESHIVFAIIWVLALMLFAAIANAQTSVPPPFAPQYFTEWVALLYSGAVYFVTFFSYKIPFLNKITYTSLRYIVIAIVAVVFGLSFGWIGTINEVLTVLGLPSFVAVLLKTLFKVKTPSVPTKQHIDSRTAAQIEADRLRKQEKMSGK